jgi:hypothetical protein
VEVIVHAIYLVFIVVFFFLVGYVIVQSVRR